MSSSWNFPAPAEPSWSELGHFNFRADKTDNIYLCQKITNCLQISQFCSCIMISINFMVIYLNLYSTKGVYRANCELRIQIRTRARTLARVQCACEKHYEMCVPCACVQPFFGRAMWDRTLAHFCTLFVAKLTITDLKLLLFCNFYSFDAIFYHQNP